MRTTAGSQLQQPSQTGGGAGSRLKERGERPSWAFMTRWHPQSPAQPVTSLGNDLLSGYVHDCQGTLQLHFHTLEFSDELVEGRGTRLARGANTFDQEVVKAARSQQSLHSHFSMNDANMLRQVYFACSKCRTSKYDP